MKVFLAIGNSNIETQIESIEGIEIIEKETELKTVKELLDFVEVDYLIINRLLDSEEAELLQDIAHRAQKKCIRIIILTHDIASEKKIITKLVAEEVNAYLEIEEFNLEDLAALIEDYPNEFNFNKLGTPEIKVIREKETITKEVVKTSVVKQEVIVCYSADNSISSAEVGRDIANTISKESDLNVLLVDFNTITPSLDFVLGIDKDLKINSVYDSDKQTSLEAIITAIDRGTLDADILKDLVIKNKKYKFDIITGIFDLIREEKTSMDHYSELIDLARDIYDAVIIVVNPYIKNIATFASLQKATKIVTITDANYAAIRNLKYTISELGSSLNRGKVRVLINNYNTISLDKSIVNQLFESYKIIGYIERDMKKEEAINKQQDYMKLADENMKRTMSDIVVNLGYTLNRKKKGFSLLRGRI